jgi:glutamate-5-semialdehyde dehydrogenase
MTTVATADEVVAAAAGAAKAAAPALAVASPAVIDEALRAMAARLETAQAPILTANQADVAAAEQAGLGVGLIDRLRLDAGRLRGMAEQLLMLAEVAVEPNRARVRDLPGGLVLEEWRRPVGVIGANFEARPNVVVDVASQLVKSRNAGVLRTGSAALGSAIALLDEVVGPALAGVRRARGRGGAGPAAHADPAGDPARQRRLDPQSGRAGCAARRTHARPR